MVRLPHVKSILSRAHTYYRLYGAAATANKVASRLLASGSKNGAVNGASLLNGCAAPGEVVVPHRAEDMAPMGPLSAGRVYIQEIDVDLTSIEEFELLLATYKRANTSRNEITLYSAGGRILHREEFDSNAVRDDQYYKLGLSRPIDLGGTGHFFLVLRSANGTRSNSITAWRTRSGGGNLYLLPAGNDETFQPRFRELHLFADARRLPGSLIYRARGRFNPPLPLYRLPPVPDGFLARCGMQNPRITIYCGETAADRRDLPPALSGRGGKLASETSVSFEAARRQIDKGATEILVLMDAPYNEFTKVLLRRAYAAYVPAVCYLNGGQGGIKTSPSQEEDCWQQTEADGESEFSRRQAMRACGWVVCANPHAAAHAASERKKAFVLDARGHGTGEPPPAPWGAVLDAHCRLHRPLVSVVGILRGNEKAIGCVIDSYFRQSYEGAIDVILVDDASPGSAAAAVEQLVSGRKCRTEGGGSIAIRVVRNDRNPGNCVSRNIGIRQARGDIVAVIDADCMINRDFIRRHVEAHAFDDCEVVIGPMNIESGDLDPRRVPDHFEQRRELTLAGSSFQDPINWASFLNCTTRNLSIKAGAITEDLFDPRFTHSSDPESGIGWEDVDMGYRLYKGGARIKFAEDPISVHISDPAASADRTTPARSIRNLSALFRKHPELALVARRWAMDTWRKLGEWADLNGFPRNEERMHLDSLFAGQAARAPAFLGSRRLRVLTYRWHVAHQYELYKLPFDFTLVTGFGSPLTDSWEFGQRPMPRNARFRRVDQVNPEDFDLAIMHFDENVLSPENTNGVTGPHWGTAFKWFRDNVNIPKVAICHGTPQFFGQYNINYDGPDLMQVIEPERIKLVEYLGDIPVVLNSHQAQREWGFGNSRVIWHGFDPTEFPPATYEKGILTPRGPLVTSRPHYRGYFLFRQVFDGYEAELRSETLRVPDPHVLYEENAFAFAKFRNYVDEIRRYSVYFNPTLRSPMPRARGEPMMCGLVTVSANNHDVDMFIKNGINGFFSNDPDELRGYLFHLLRNPEQCRKIGAASRETAMTVFNHDRFLHDWRRLVGDLVG